MQGKKEQEVVSVLPEAIYQKKKRDMPDVPPGSRTES